MRIHKPNPCIGLQKIKIENQKLKEEFAIYTDS